MSAQGERFVQKIDGKIFSHTDRECEVSKEFAYRMTLQQKAEFLKLQTYQNYTLIYSITKEIHAVSIPS